ncbi:MAG: hypothetical protein Q4Q04_04020 [Methanocorpusculum sp.]|nr:hypothetical protein [Methanocorpusculum sp.]
MNVLAVIVVVFLAVTVAGTGAGVITQITESPAAEPITPPGQGSSSPSPSGNPATPSAAVTVKATGVPTAVPTPVLTPAASLKPTVAPLQAEGAALLSGNWYGAKSVLFGVVSGEFYATGNADGTAVFSGAIKAPTFGFDNAEFNTPAVWEYLGNNQFKAVISDTETAFTCDGTTLTITLNAYTFGFVDTSMANIDIPVDLKRM